MIGLKSFLPLYRPESFPLLPVPIVLDAKVKLTTNSTAITFSQHELSLILGYAWRLSVSWEEGERGGGACICVGIYLFTVGMQMMEVEPSGTWYLFADLLGTFCCI